VETLYSQKLILNLTTNLIILYLPLRLEIGATIWDKVPKHLRNNQNQRKRQTRGDASVLEGENAYRGPWATYEGDRIGELSGPTEEERDAHDKQVEAATEEKQARDKTKPSKSIAAGSETTIFHGKEEHDYLGRTYMHVPQDLDVNLNGEPGTQMCFVPKKLLHTYTGHTKGVSAIRYFPKSAHLLLSGSMDTKIKVGSSFCELCWLCALKAIIKADFPSLSLNNRSGMYTTIVGCFAHTWVTQRQFEMLTSTTMARSS
jgi:hypothetical protein